MHILQSENRTEGHAQPLWTLEADKTPMRKKYIYLYRFVFFFSYFFLILIIVELSQTPGTSSSPHYMAHFSCDKKKRREKSKKKCEQAKYKAEMFVNNCCQLKQIINMVL